jgi:hypothetical protein
MQVTTGVRDSNASCAGPLQIHVGDRRSIFALNP